MINFKFRSYNTYDDLFSGNRFDVLYNKIEYDALSRSIWRQSHLLWLQPYNYNILSNAILSTIKFGYHS